MGKRGRAKTIDNRKELYEKGLNDAEIAEKIGVWPGTICAWRKRNDLPYNYTPGNSYRKALPRSEWCKGAAFVYTMAIMRKYCVDHKVDKVNIDMEHVRRAFDEYRKRVGV
ncbi:MAG: hypothetical protein H6Q71_1465 [Firmicutes bacterium]|nr:hypothetical protein [Bacillota bacterium]